MADIAVPRAEVAELLGLPADTDDETLRKAMADLVAAHQAREAEAIAAAAEQRLVAEDRRLVHAAIKDGRLPREREGFWLDACKRDRGNRAIIASLAPVLADIEAERTHAKVMGQLGLAPQPRTVAASFGDWGIPMDEASPYGTPDIPAPVLLRKGTDRADYTKEQQYQEFAHKLGGKFTEGVPKPPAGDVYYMPSPNDHVELKNGEWVEKHPYRENPA